MPNQFWELTPKEFSIMVRQYKIKEHNKRLLLCWQVANIMNAAGNYKPKITVDKLLENLEGKKVVKKTKEEIKEEKEYLKEKFKGRKFGEITKD